MLCSILVLAGSKRSSESPDNCGKDLGICLSVSSASATPASSPSQGGSAAAGGSGLGSGGASGSGSGGAGLEGAGGSGAAIASDIRAAGASDLGVAVPTLMPPIFFRTTMSRTAMTKEMDHMEMIWASLTCSVVCL